MQGGTPQQRYLIVSDAAQVEPARKIWGAVYTCISREQALNGMQQEIADKKIVLWPSPEAVDDAAKFGRELARLSPEVKLIHTELGTDFPLSIQAQIDWNSADSYKWMSGGQDDYNRIEVLEPAEEAEIPLTAKEKRELAKINESPQLSGPPFGDTDAAGPPSGALGAVGDSPFQEVPIEAYSGDSGPLSADEAYIPYRTHAEASGGDSGWPEPVDFWREAKVPEMRREWCPHELTDLLFHEAESWGTDPGIYVMYALGICAGALSNAITVQVKDGDAHALKAARPWIGVNAMSGSGKSPSLLSLARPLEALQEKLMLEVAYLQKKHIDDTEIYQKQRQGYISVMAKGGPESLSAQRPIEPEAPAKNRLIVKNITLEALPDILGEQGQRGILGIYDELTAFPAGAGQYKKGGNDIEEMLKLRDGGIHSVDRKGVFTPIKEFGMTIVGGTQPNRIRSVCKRMDLTSNGFLQRWNFYSAREATRDLDRPAHADYARLTDIVDRIYHLMSDGPVRFSEGAQAVRREFREWCFVNRQPAWLSDSLKSHLSKYGDMFAEYCLTFHAIESADQHCAYIKPEISEATVRRVQALMQDCLWPHAKAFYSDVIESDGETVKYVRYLAGKILAKGWTTIDLRVVAQGWTKFRTLKPWEKKAIFTMLSESGWTQSLDPRGYIDGRAYRARVNPSVHTIFNQYADVERARLEEMAERREENMGD